MREVKSVNMAKAVPAADMKKISVLTPTHRYAAAALFSLALRQAQIHQTRPFGVASSPSSHVDHDDHESQPWTHPSCRLLRSVFRFDCLFHFHIRKPWNRSLVLVICSCDRDSQVPGDRSESLARSWGNCSFVCLQPSCRRCMYANFVSLNRIIILLTHWRRVLRVSLWLSSLNSPPSVLIIRLIRSLSQFTTLLFSLFV